MHHSNRKMPGLEQRNEHNVETASFSRSDSSTEFWSKHRDDVSYDQLQKFWSELSPQARQELLRVDKQTFFEHARKHMYCSRCNGLLLEGFYQIVMYGKSMHDEGASVHHPCNNLGTLKDQGEDDVQAPSVHPWGGLTTTRDGTLTLLDCYIYTKSLKGLQNVFDSARARERERELQYPDACGGGGRGWKSQGTTGYGRGHGSRETCALHSARLAVDTLVDFWSALGEETRYSLFRMKEEDFIERLMYRFDSKRFCRDCRRNVIREFKELKELKRMKKVTRCTSFFCVADTAFQYEVSQNSIHACWHHAFVDTLGTYHHFEWAVGTGEGKSDILGFENVGLRGRVQANDLDLGSYSACYITLRAWKMDGRCSELSVKAHALKGKHCVHCKLAVGDGFVTISPGENIRRFFEHAEEADEEEDDDGMDKDENDFDGECTRPQKHAKSPELAREFLLDAATVMFKEQVEKAFREGTARQNAHIIFVSHALKLLEERLQVACKEIITLEKQNKLLEEEEKEKRKEEERKERKRLKEKEKKNRKKERLREKEKGRGDKSHESDQNHEAVLEEELAHCVNEIEEPLIPSSSCLDDQDNTSLNGYNPSDSFNHNDIAKEEFELHSGSKWADNTSLSRKYEGRNQQLRNNMARTGRPKFSEKFHCPEYRVKAAPSMPRWTKPPKNKSTAWGSNPSNRGLPFTKKVWEPTYPRTNPEANVTSASKNCDSVSEISVQTIPKDDEENDLKTSTISSSNSDNCSSCLSEGDSSHILNQESSSTSDSEESCQNSSEGKRPVPLPPTLGVHPPAVLPPVYNQNAQFPVFEHPSTGYYYQTPAAPANGLMPFPYSGEYLFTSHVQNGNPPPFMHYTQPQPLYNSGCFPVFQSPAKTQGIAISSKETATSVERTGHGHGSKFEKHDGESPGFSLFAFSDPISVREGVVGSFSQSLSMYQMKGDHGCCNKEAPVEEYNPFANGIQFSFSDIVS